MLGHSTILIINNSYIKVGNFCLHITGGPK